MSHDGPITHDIANRHASPWTLKQRVGLLLWEWAWGLLCVWTPKPLYRWRLLILRLFGAKIHGTPFVHQRARIQIPWHLTLHDHCAIGDRTNLYSLGPIEVGPQATVAQEAYLCTGTHLFDHPNQPLVTAKIVIGANAFIGARTFILPGITVSSNAIVGACSLVTKNIPANSIWAGSPARFKRWREA
jgi:putative colanic acid biosynthesis acetyltransferase WcaF